jgi:hypothetical protein
LDQSTAEQFTNMLNPQILLDQPKLEQLRTTLPTEIHETFENMISMLRSVLDDTLSTVFYIGAALIIIGLILTFFLKEIPLRTSEK